MDNAHKSVLVKYPRVFRDIFIARFDIFSSIKIGIYDYSVSRCNDVAEASRPPRINSHTGVKFLFARGPERDKSDSFSHYVMGVIARRPTRAVRREIARDDRFQRSLRIGRRLLLNGGSPLTGTRSGRGRRLSGPPLRLSRKYLGGGKRFSISARSDLSRP